MIKLSKIDKITDSYVDNIRESKNPRAYIQQIQDFMYEAYIHKLLTQEEYEKIYCYYKECLKQY